MKKSKAFSFVYPRNKIKYLYLLYKNGFKAFRGADKSNLELIIPRIPPVYEPTLHYKLVNIPGSMYLVSSRGLRMLIPYGLRYTKAKFGINMAIKNRKVFHLWFHPVDFADNTDSLFSELELILKYAYKKREEKLLQIKTMKDIANDYSLIL